MEKPFANVLFVAADPSERASYAAALRAAGLRVQTTGTFHQAKELLIELRPDVLVTNVRLAEYNGLHLALWAQRQLPLIRTVIVGRSDPGLERDAHVAGLFFMTDDDEQAVLQATLEAAARRVPRRRWHRKVLSAAMPVFIDGEAAAIVDVSYGGFRAESGRPFAIAADRGMQLEVPGVEHRTPAVCRWVATQEVCSCGASVGDAHTSRGSPWRAFVDRLLSAEPAT